MLDPKGAASPAGQVANAAIEGSFRDEAKIKELAAVSDVLTVEIEHVNCDILAELEKGGMPVHPSPATVALIQDKFAQKQHMAAAGVPCGPFVDTPTQAAVADAGRRWGYPLMLKSKRLAYDGRGNAVVASAADVDRAWAQLGGGAQGREGGLYAEKWVPFSKELACMVVRTTGEGVSAYPVVETVQRDNICHTVVVPAQVPGAAYANAVKVCSEAIAALPANSRGVYGVEVFLLDDGKDTVLFNEVAPRPHNSGHYTIEACGMDQFEVHLRAILGLPIPPGATHLRVGCAMMVNLLGAPTGGRDATLSVLRRGLDVPGCGIHWYGKDEARPGRKMAHVTITAPDYATLRDRVRQYEGLDAAAGAGADGGAAALLQVAPLVGVIMGSDSDLPTMAAACKVLEDFGVAFECTVVSAHRTPGRMFDYARTAHERGVRVIIAGAGGAAHLPGMVAALTPLPVVGVPVKTSNSVGTNASLLSIVQMPRGVPVATVAVGNAMNAGLLAVRILAAGTGPRGASGSAAAATQGEACLQQMSAFMERQRDRVGDIAERLEGQGWKDYLAAYVAAKERGSHPVPERQALRKIVDDAERRTQSYLPKIRAQFARVVASTDLQLRPKNGWAKVKKIVGKVRDRYETGAEVVLVTTDRLSAFDRQLSEIPFKGQVLNLTSKWWFEQLKHIVPNHVLGTPHPNVTVGRACAPFPIEFVMRGYITGSSGTAMWTHYSKGCRDYCGHKLPEGMVKNQKLWTNLLTPTTKDDEHDALISAEAIVRDGIMTKADWDFCAAKAQAIFAHGQKLAAEHGLILVDTKYEFGRDVATGEILLIDEVHTPDSSRYWIAASYEANMAAGKQPEQIDKEFIRLWFKDRCDPYKDEVMPTAPQELCAELGRRYIMIYELITGEEFAFAPAGPAEMNASVAAALGAANGTA